MGILLELRRVPDIPLEADCLNPSITALAPDAIARLELWQGKTRVPVGEFFAVRRVDTDCEEELIVEGDLARVKRLGQGTASGRLVLRGDCGMHTCEDMRGGEAEIFGDVDNWSFCLMQGGTARIHGSAGAFLAAAFPGDARGMKGGTIWVRGDVGARAVERMRRGLLVAGGKIGEAAAVEMIAGTVVALGYLGERAGASMKRGTILAMGGHGPLLPGFSRACAYDPTFVGLLGRELARMGFVEDARPFTAPPGGFVRWCGDLVSLGKGEILVHG